MDGHEAAYLAGFFDGEGCVGAYMQGEKVVLRISVSNTHHPSLLRFKAAFGGSIQSIRNHGNRKPQWQWIANGQRAKDALAAMRPYMNTKAAQADIAATWPIGPVGRPRRRTEIGTWGMEPGLREAKADIRARLRVLNKRGVA